MTANAKSLKDHLKQLLKRLSLRQIRLRFLPVFSNDAKQTKNIGIESAKKAASNKFGFG